MQIYQNALVLSASETFQLISLLVILLSAEDPSLLESSFPSGKRPIDSGFLRKINSIGIQIMKAYKPNILYPFRQFEAQLEIS